MGNCGYKKRINIRKRIKTIKIDQNLKKRQDQNIKTPNSEQNVTNQPVPNNAENRNLDNIDINYEQEMLSQKLSNQPIPNNIENISSDNILLPGKSSSDETISTSTESPADIFQICQFILPQISPSSPNQVEDDVFLDNIIANKLPETDRGIATLPPPCLKTKVRAVFSFNPSRDDDLQFRKGDFLYIISNTKDAWWRAEHTVTKEIGFVPSNYVVIDDGSPRSHEAWFNIGRLESERKLILPGYEEGTFIIRPSSCSRSYALSVRVFDVTKQFYVVKHYVIKALKSGEYCIAAVNKFTSIKSLIHYYRRHGNGLSCRLKDPFPKGDRPNIQFRDIEVNRDCIMLVNEVGRGNFGEVWLAKWNSSVEVAVKMLKGNALHENQRKIFLDEAQLLHKLHHPKIVEIMGICSSDLEKPVYIITEFMAKGSLFKYLKENSERLILLKDMVSMLTQIASGMSYLESVNFIHRDLRTANILVADDLTVKVSDFGLARCIEGTYKASESKFPVRWTAPEAGLRGLFSIKSDVWSFGVLAYEIVTYGKEPYTDLDISEVLPSTERGVRLERPTGKNIECPDGVFNVMKSCWHAIPEQRPTFIHLKDVFENYQIYAERKYELSEY